MVNRLEKSYAGNPRTRFGAGEGASAAMPGCGSLFYKFRPIDNLLVAKVIALSAISAFGVDIGDYSYSYDLTTKEGTITSYRGASSSISIPMSFTVAETYRDDDDGEMHTRNHTITVIGIGRSVFAGKAFITSVSFHNKRQFINSCSASVEA